VRHTVHVEQGLRGRAMVSLKNHAIRKIRRVRSIIGRENALEIISDSHEMEIVTEIGKHHVWRIVRRHIRGVVARTRSFHVVPPSFDVWKCVTQRFAVLTRFGLNGPVSC
jgi:hypothetical protein